jgi:hypothetical protein
MQIEIDAATVAKLRAQAEAKAVDQMVAGIMAQFDAKQIAGEVKNAAIRAASQRIAEQVKTDSSTVIARALQSAEERARAQIAAQLTKGIIVKFSE